MKNYLFLILLVSCSLTSFTQSTAVPFTLEDRDRIMRTEQEIKSLRNEMSSEIKSLRNEMSSEIKSLRNEMNTRFESQQRQIDDIKESISDIKILLLWGFGILFSLFLFMLGFIIWDRRTALKPVQKTQETLVKTLIEYSRKHTDLSEIFKKAGVL